MSLDLLQTLRNDTIWLIFKFDNKPALIGLPQVLERDVSYGRRYTESTLAPYAVLETIQKRRR